MLAKFKQRLHSRRSTAQKSAPVLSGIDFLPSEILGGEIFSLVVDEDILWHQTLLALASVCTQWRNIVHSTPFLWNQPIRINTLQLFSLGRFRRKRIAKKYFEALRMCLTRSAPLPVSIWVDSPTLIGDRKDFARTVDLISDAAVRIEVLRISSLHGDDGGVCILRVLERLPNGSLHALTEIDFRHLSSAALHPTVSFSLMNAPNLRRVKLSAGPHPLNSISIPWPQLTHLTLAAPPLACLAVLAKCSNLVSAVLHHVYTSFPDDTTPTSATLVHLTSLRLTISSTLIQAIGNLVLPALTALELIYDDADMIWPQLEVFRQLPLHNIQYLMIDLDREEVLDSATLCTLLRCTPSVTELKLTDCVYINNAFLNALRADGPRSKLLLPHLELFSIEWGSVLGTYFFDLKTLQAMLASRAAVGLRRFVYRGDYSEEVPVLAAYHADGLQVDVSVTIHILFLGLVMHPEARRNAQQETSKYQREDYLEMGTLSPSYLFFVPDFLFHPALNKASSSSSTRCVRP
ncbi:hypothetical protein B0H16DRAFT_1721228 [Mycena metata]|uniref:F-box domain-containing protein n=1 Tax=Mycena metata TaxID=1033252 RepID=A0AAD7J5D0_9AGAR|nr:hypothetical protein B0H16DRAFT_1721228 [Mycena metata]